MKAGPDGISRLTPLLADPDIAVRVEAIKAAVEIGSQYSLGPLTKALSDPDAEIQIRAIDGLVNFYLPGYTKNAMSSSIKRSDASVTGRFKQETEDRVIDPYVGARPEIVIGIAGLLRDSTNNSVRANAARALGVLRGREGLQELHSALRSKETDLMYESLTALTKIGDPKSGSAVRFLFRDPEEKIASTALETAGLVRSQETLPDMEAVYSESGSSKVRRAALNSMAAIADPSSREKFVEGLGSNDEYIRAASLEGLGRLKIATDVPSIHGYFGSERKVPPRLAAAFALVMNGRTETGESSPLSYLIDTLNSRAWTGIAEAYLIELARAKKVRTTVETYLPVATKNEKIALTRILAASGDKDSVIAIERLSRDSEPAVMEEALRALRTLRSREP